MSSFDDGSGAHPLFDTGNADRLQRIVVVMHQTILKTLRRSRGDGRAERMLRSGVSADDVLQEAFLALWRFDPQRLERDWEALAVRIARNKAVDALRRMANVEIHSLDEPIRPGEVDSPSVGESLPGGCSPEREFAAVYQPWKLVLLSRHLSIRDAPSSSRSSSGAEAAQTSAERSG